MQIGDAEMSGALMKMIEGGNEFIKAFEQREAAGNREQRKAAVNIRNGLFMHLSHCQKLKADLENGKAK
jgi:hypothetical protein